MDTLSRRRFIEFLRASPLFLPHALAEQKPAGQLMAAPAEAMNVFDFMPVAQKNIAPQHWAYLMTGSDDNLTLQANRDGFQLFQIRPRRFVDIENIDTSVELFGQRQSSPIFLAPCGSQRAFHSQGEVATARAARAAGAQMILSTVTSTYVQDVVREYQQPLWYQLYPTNDWEITRQLIGRAQDAGCPVLVLTADSPTVSNREMQHRWNKANPQCRACHGPDIQSNLREHAMFTGLDISRVRSYVYPYTWPLIERIRQTTRMELVVKGVVTAEDAQLCVKNGVDGIIVSNHGGRQEESLLSTIEALPEVVAAVNGKIPVLIDSGFRRGTDVFKALALGASAVCIGRPYLWGLGAFGQPGVERVHQLLQAELVTTMKLAGTTSIPAITPDYVRRRPALIR
jgi:4-hydroxymandelate oxidase